MYNLPDGAAFACIQTAIAASVDLRCYAESSGREDGKLELNLPDLNFKHSWNIEADLPWDAVSKQGYQQAPKELDVKLMEAITARAVPVPLLNDGTERYKLAAAAFLYVYMSLATDGYR